MKQLAIFIILVSSIFGFSKAGNCTAQNIQTIENCYGDLFLYKLDFSYPYLAPNFVQEMKAQMSNSAGVVQRCRQHRSFQNCLKKDNSSDDIAANCVNVDDFLQLSFSRNVTKWAKQYVTSFIELNYVCGDGYKIFSYATDCIKQVPAKCAAQFNDTDDHDCGYEKEYAECMKDTTAQDCGDAAGCFAYKDATISICYYETNCTECEYLNFNENFYSNLCDSDAKFTLPPTTAAVTTTTEMPSTTSDGASTFPTFLILFFSFSLARIVKLNFHL
uniref:Uncharacterized protein n=1 Tax=Panagrolaimus sp. PS1159 TaxID=55785 RepID=A0AC35F1Y1_9BILA